MLFKDFESTKFSSDQMVKMEPGTSIQGIFRGNPYDFRQHWIKGSDSKERSYVCTGSSTCEYCKLGDRSKFRFQINIVLRENNAYVVKIFEQGKTVYDTLKALQKDGYDLEKHVVKITRNGAKTDTTYTITPIKNGELNDEQVAQISKIQLHNLTPEGKQNAETTPPRDPAFDEIPF